MFTTVGLIVVVLIVLSLLYVRNWLPVPIILPLWRVLSLYVSFYGQLVVYFAFWYNLIHAFQKVEQPIGIED